MKRVLIESPFAGDVQGNLEYLKDCLRDSLARKEAPYASHLFFTQFLNDLDPQERLQGITAGLCWGEAAQLTAVYTDRGISKGMQYGIEVAQACKRPIEYRSLKK